MKQLTRQDIADIAEYRRNGKTFVEIAKIYGCGKTTIQRYCKVKRGRGEIRMEEEDLTLYGERRGALVVQSDFEQFAYGIDKQNDTLLFIDKRTGGITEIDRADVCKLAYEMMDVMDLYMGAKGLFEVS